MKTATTRLFLLMLAIISMFACSFGEAVYDQDYLDSLSKGGTTSIISKAIGGSVSTTTTANQCLPPCHLETVQLMSVKPRSGLTPSKSVMGLDGNGVGVCVCPNGTGGATSTTSAEGGSGNTQDPPPATGGTGDTLDPSKGGSTNTDYPSYGGASATGGATSTTSAEGGSGNTQDPPPATGGTGDTLDPPKGGSCGCPSGGASSTGGKSSTGGSSYGQGGGSTQDPPPAGAAGMAGSTGIGGGTTQDPPGTGGKSSTGGTSATGGSLGSGGGTTQDPPKGGTSSTGGASSTGGTTGTGGAPCGQELKWYITSPGTLKAPSTYCWNPTTGAVLNPNPTPCIDGVYCYFQIQDLVPEQEWRCYVNTGNATTPRLPIRNASGKCVNAWGVTPYITTAEHYQLYAEDWSVIDDTTAGCVYSLRVTSTCYYAAGVCLQ